MVPPKDIAWLNEYKGKTHVYVVYIYRRPISELETYRLKRRGWKKIFHLKGIQKKAGVAILILDKMDFKIKTITRDKEGHCINDQGINLRRR